MQFGKRKGMVQRKLANDQERPVVANEPRRSFEGVEVRRASAHRFLWQSHAPEQVSALSRRKTTREREKQSRRAVNPNLSRYQSPNEIGFFAQKA